MTGTSGENTQAELSASIARHGAYIWETKRIFDVYIETESYDELKSAVLEDNLLRKGSERYRSDILSEITRRYHIAKDGFRETPLIRAYRRNLSESVWESLLYYEFSQDRLVKYLTTEFLYPRYQDGVLVLRKEDLLTFLENASSTRDEFESWSENTCLSVAEHYLASMKNFGILEGSTEKEFSYVYPPDQLVAYILYTLFEHGHTSADEVVNHTDWRVVLFDQDDVRERLRGISPTHVTYEKRGSVERLEPRYDSLMECVDEF